MNILDHFIVQSEVNKQLPAIITHDLSISFEDLEKKSNDLAFNFRKQGLKKGNIVLVMLGMDLNLYITLLALFRMGATALFPDPSTGLEGIKQIVSSLKIDAFIGCWKSSVLKTIYPSLRSIPLNLSLRIHENTKKTILENLSEDHPALITFTSGSTGRPKGIVRSHEFLVNQHQSLLRLLKPTKEDIDLISLPVFLLSNLAYGICSVIPCGNLRQPGKLNPNPIFEQITGHGVTRILAPPALCRCLYEPGKKFSQVKRVFTGGGPVFPEQLRRISSSFPHAKVTAIYGSTEAEPIAHIDLEEISDSDFHIMQTGGGLLAGSPSEDMEVKLYENEIIVTGPQVIKGYLDPVDNVSTKLLLDKKIWHRTGDAGRIDENGRIWLLGRLNASHQGIYPFCIETAARSYLGVKEAAFIGNKGENYIILETTKLYDKGSDSLLMKQFPGIKLIKARIPLDKRHNSKVDYKRLRELYFDK